MLVDLDHMLGLLHSDEAAPLGPGRSMPNIAELVADTRAAGADVRLHDECEYEVDTATGSAAYRVVQEALTNAIKHATGAPIDVTLRCDSNDLVVIIANDDTAASGAHRETTASDISGGRGVSGMTERVKVLGGRITVGSDHAGRFVVDVRLPCRARHRRQSRQNETMHGA